jgi:hypothetical protein
VPPRGRPFGGGGTIIKWGLGQSPNQLGAYAINLPTHFAEAPDKVYKIDLELDQIMTCFKMSFINLSSLFLTKCMNHEKFELLTLFESIFLLDGNAFIDGENKVIELVMNPKEAELMDKLSKGLSSLNGMDIQDMSGRSIQFKV